VVVRGQKMVDRIIELLEKDPELTNFALRERLGVTQTTIKKARKLCGIEVPEPINKHYKIKTPERWPNPVKKDDERIK